MILVALALILPETDRADIETASAGVECSAIAARAEIFLFLRHIFFVVIRVGLCIKAVPNDQRQF